MSRRNKKLSKSLRELGDIQVNSWDLKEVVPGLQRLAHREVDIVGLLKRAADYKINDWDIREALLRSRAKEKKLSPQEIKELSDKLENFLRYMVDHLIDEPKRCSILIDEIAPQVLLCRVILKQRDLSVLIGMNGLTAQPLRRVVKDIALLAGAYCLLQIQTPEEAAGTDA